MQRLFHPKLYSTQYICPLEKNITKEIGRVSHSSLNERDVVDGHCFHTALIFGVKAKGNQDRLPTLCW